MAAEDRAARRAYRRRRRHERGWLRSVRHRLRPLVARPLLRGAAWLVPPLYDLYMGLVWRTSRIVDHGITRLHGILEERGGAVALAWHEEVLTVAYAYPHLGLQPHTLASRSDLGEIITRLLERRGYTVSRGGSSRRRSRRDHGALEYMIRHRGESSNVLYGLTVDGSHGPAYRMKRGGVLLARECGKPVVLLRTWSRRCLRLGSWDRSALPLPFNEIHYYLEGPYDVPEDAGTSAGLERFRRHLESELKALAVRSYRDVGQTTPPRLLEEGPPDHVR